MPVGDPKNEIKLDDLTRVFNPLEEDFVWPIGGIDYTVPTKGFKTLPRHACQLIAKHIADKILQEQYGIPDTNADTAIRRKILMDLLPDDVESLGASVSPEEAKESAEVMRKKAQNLVQSSTDPNHPSKKKAVKAVPSV